MNLVWIKITLGVGGAKKRGTKFSAASRRVARKKKSSNSTPVIIVMRSRRGTWWWYRRLETSSSADVAHTLYGRRQVCYIADIASPYGYVLRLCETRWLHASLSASGQDAREMNLFPAPRTVRWLLGFGRGRANFLHVTHTLIPKGLSSVYQTDSYWMSGVNLCVNLVNIQ